MSDTVKGSEGRRQEEHQSRILLVHASLRAAEDLARRLRAVGHVVKHADDGPEAIDRLSDPTYDALIVLRPDQVTFLLPASAETSAPNSPLRSFDCLTFASLSLDDLVLEIGRALEKKRRRGDAPSRRSQVEALDGTDAADTVRDRASFDRSLPSELARAHRHGTGLGTLMLAINDLEEIRSSKGDEGAEAALRAFAQIAAHELRESDLLFRYDSSRVVALLPHADVAGAMSAAERIVAAVRRRPVTVGPAAIQLTMSAGAASLESSDLSGEGLLDRAKAALREAESSGTNLVYASGTPLRSSGQKAGWKLRSVWQRTDRRRAAA